MLKVRNKDTTLCRNIKLYTTLFTYSYKKELLENGYQKNFWKKKEIGNKDILTISLPQTLSKLQETSNSGNHKLKFEKNKFISKMKLTLSDKMVKQKQYQTITKAWIKEQLLC